MVMNVAGRGEWREMVFAPMEAQLTDCVGL